MDSEEITQFILYHTTYVPPWNLRQYKLPD
jgi:hypothetical protein